MNINTTLNSKILAILQTEKRPFKTILNDKQLMEYINNNTPLLVKNGNSLQTKLYWIFNNITEFPICQNEKCENYGKPIKKDVYSFYDGYSRLHDPHIHCNNRCAQLDKATINHVKQTKLNNYGDENFNNREKAEHTCFDKYGVTHTSKLKENRERAAETNLIIHGSKNYRNIEQIKQTNLRKTGYPWTFCNPDVKIKSQQTNIQHRGVPFPAQSKEVNDKAKATLLKNYGVTCSFNIPGNKEKARYDYFLKTGYEHPMLNPEVQKKHKKRYLYNNINFDSSWELALYIFCKDNNIDVEYMPDIRFKYIDPITNSIKWYLPDFKINGQLIEIKGDQFFDEHGNMINPFDHSQDMLYEAKHKCMIDNNIKILKYNDIQIYLKYIEQKYGKHYLRQFKRI